MIKDKVVRIQGDRLNDYLGLPKGTYIERPILDAILNGVVGNELVILGKPIILTPSVKTLAELIIKKS